MSQFATLDEVKHHLRYDDDSNNTILAIYLQTAENAVKNYITDEIADEIADEMLPSLKTATLLMVGYLDDNRDGKQGEQFGNYLPACVRQILSPYRKLTI